MNSVTGLSGAFKLYSSDKIKDRGQGSTLLREIISNRSNLERLQDTASRDGGQGWIALFQCLFTAVVVEKKAVCKKISAESGSGLVAAQRRLSDAADLVRFVAERSVHMIARKPARTLVLHMIALLVHEGRIFEPVAISYVKTLRTLLSYPPHLEHMEDDSWRKLMAISWAAILGDKIPSGDEWYDSGDVLAEKDENGAEDEEDVKPFLPASTPVVTEFVTLIPILLSSSSAPLIPPPPGKMDDQKPSVGLSILKKIRRYIAGVPSNAVVPIDILRALNILQGELELNCRQDFTQSSLKLFPQLAALWTARTKGDLGHREHVMVGLRTMLPFVTHSAALGNPSQKEAVKEGMARILDSVPKEAGSRAAIKPIDLETLRFKAGGTKLPDSNGRPPFELMGVTAGFGFDAAQALSWATIELYADCCFHTYDLSNAPSSSALSSSTQTQAPATKRRRREGGSLEKLLNLIIGGNAQTRLLACQIIVFFIDKHWSRIHSEAKDNVRRRFMQLLDDDDMELQSWAFICLACFATINSKSETQDRLNPPITPSQRQIQTSSWGILWSHAVRKTSTLPLSRTASHAAEVLLHTGKVDHARALRDIHQLLKNVDIQGPPVAFETATSFLTACLDRVRADSGLYAANLEDKVIDWFGRAYSSEGHRKTVGPVTPANILRLLTHLCAFTPKGLEDVTVLELLPDCPIVNRMLEEATTDPLRRLILDATMPPVPELRKKNLVVTPAQTDSDSLLYLDGRPRKLSDFLSIAMERTLLEWNQNAKSNLPSLMTAPRIRKSVDLVVIALTFQASIQANGFRPDSTGSLRLAVDLLTTLLPHIRTMTESIPAQLLVWRAFAPLYLNHKARPEIWPILLKPDRASGIRRDLLPSSRYASHFDDDEEQDGPPSSASLLSLVWSNQQTSEALDDLVQTAKHALENVRTSRSGAVALQAIDDDDFGPILNADTDTMPQSLEARVAQRSTSSLLKTLVDLRLRSQKLRSPLYRPSKDIALINTFIDAESSQFAQIGFALCDAIQDGNLRLSVDIVDAILAEIEVRIDTYGFKRDSELIRLTVLLLAKTATVWLSPESGLCERAIGQVKSFVAKVQAGYPISWQARLQLLLFVDEYLEYDPTYTAWLQLSETDEADVIMGGDQPEPYGPVQYTLDMTSDSDARVRFRAVTSAAAVHYLPDMDADLKAGAYYNVLNGQAEDSFSDDRFLTNIVWKINTCIASAQLRSGPIFHLYEVADYARAFMFYLRPGLTAIAHRLGLSSLKPLYRAHANIVVVNQLGGGQLPLGLPSEIYGCARRKEFAQLCLEMVGPKILSEPSMPNNLKFFSALCEAAGFEEMQARMRHLPYAAAIATTHAVAELEVPDVTTIYTQGVEALSSLQQDDGLDVNDYLAKNAETTIAGLFVLPDASTPNGEVAGCLENFSHAGSDAPDIFTRLMHSDQNRGETPPSLDPAATVPSVLYAHHFFKTHFKQWSKSRMVFAAIIRLFHEVNSAYLVNEQRRYLRSVALVASLYPSEFKTPLILQEFLRNAIDLLTMDDLGQIALSMVQWGFDRVQTAAPEVPSELPTLLIKLGTAYSELHAKPHMAVVADDLDKWIAGKAQPWIMSDVIANALDTALVFWPQHWVDQFRVPHQHFLEVAEMAKRPNIKNAMALSSRLAEAAARKTTEPNKEAFLTATFWYLKQGLRQEEWTRDGAIAFLDLLHMVNGEVHAPSLETIKNLTGRTDILQIAKKLIGRSHDALRVSVLLKILEQTASDDYRLRFTAYEVLRTTLPIMTSLASALPSHLLELTDVLVSDTPASSSEVPVLEALATEANWIAKSHSHEVWVKDLALMLGALASTNDAFYACLQPMLSAEGNAAIVLLPLLVQAVLDCDDVDVGIQRAGTLSDHFSQVLQHPMASSQTVESIIQIVLHLRNFAPRYGNGELAYNHWLSIDPLVLSEAAGKCGAFASSLLFLEMAKDRDDGNQDLDLSNDRIQKIMYDIYSNVEDPDGFYGIQNNNVMDSLHRRLDHEGEPLRAMGYNLAEVEAGQQTPSLNGPLISALQNLHALGFDTLAGSFMKSFKATGEVKSDSEPFFLELAWRMGDWDVPVTKELAATSAGRFYTALRAVHRERDYEVARVAVNNSIRAEMAHLQQIGVERMTEIKKSTLNLLCLRDVERWVSLPLQQALEQDDFEGGLLTGFTDMDASFEFNNAERLSATRLSLIRSARARESKNLFGDLVSLQAEGLIKMESRTQLQMSRLARKEGNLQAAVNAITAVRKLEKEVGVSEPAEDEFSQVLWAQGEHSLAISHIGSILTPLRLMDNEKARKGLPAITARHAILLSRKANWYWLARLKSAEEIRSISRRAMDLATEGKASQEEQAQMAHDFAVFTDRYYEVLAKSPELERIKSYVDRRQVEYNKELEREQSAKPRSRKSSTVLPDQLLEEESQNKANMEAELSRYLVYALRCYAVALTYSDKFDDSVTRLCSLWLEHDKDDVANEKFGLKLKLIPTHKFLFLSPQLSAKLFRPSTPTQFNSLLNDLVLRIARDHPYHILYQIITLAVNGKAAAPRSSSTSSRSKSADGRTAASNEILASIKKDKHRPVAQEAVTAMITFATSAVQWCYSDIGKKNNPGTPLQATAADPLMQCRGLKIPVATVSLPVDLTTRYDSIPTLDRYRSDFKRAGGIHKPAIMTCVDSLGEEHVQLFKGEDDVRQDAVMEQVFEMTNRLLQRDRRTNIRNLKFRTYNVVHLANSTGIIQFVGNTMAIGEWLKEAHSRYRKGIDVPADMIRKKLAKLQTEDKPGGSGSAMTKAFKEYMAQFQPVMRHFFTEKRREPLAWFTMRLNYARSVAVTSMVGWMVGLGDRHCSNILIDKVTGELVHIDFGIVFEEGKKLRIPERVPFRLTNDIVDGLGVTGVEGTFRQCSEHTLRVLRESAELILTVLEVFKHDPLHNWVGDPSKMQRAGGGQAQTHSSAGQDKADRVLTQIRQKLGPELSVEYRVNQLMQEARSDEHLARIFVGWQPWM